MDRLGVAPDSPNGRCEEHIQHRLDEFKQRFEEAMDNDLNTSVALSVIFEMIKWMAPFLDDSSTSVESLQEIEAVFNQIGSTLGLLKDEYPEAYGADEGLLDHLICLMIEQRQAARKNRDFAASDAIRDKLAGFGIILEDKPGGLTAWRRQ
jgi:cysteinyl-tRNA synthetase